MKYILLILFVFNVKISYSQVLTSQDYTKKEVYITMRDGIRLFTSIYSPKDTTIDYPALVTRTTYSCEPYGENNIPDNILYNPDLVAEGYIFVFQDVRGRWMSEGVFENTKPPYSLWDKNRTDEVTDAWDTFEWLAKNLKHFNGNIGVYGNSYLGWSTLTAASANHPAVKCALAMSPVTDFFFEDFTRYGLVAINYAPVWNAFGIQKDYPASKSWYHLSNKFILDAKTNKTVDYYQYFLDLFTLKGIEKDMIDSNNVFWQKLMQHPNYDDYRQKHNWLNYIKNIKTQVMIAGGWNDEQNLYGILKSYKTLMYDKYSNVKLVMGPWAHSHPKSRDSLYYLGDIFYGYDLAEKYQKEVQFPYFEYYLKGKGEEPVFKMKIFDTGLKKWVTKKNNLYHHDGIKIKFYLDESGMLSHIKKDKAGSRSYVSDPFNPVPFIEERQFYYIAPKYYMTDDQRYASKRKDVLTYVSEPLIRDMTVFGAPKANIVFSTDHTDADIYVKIIDEYPPDRTAEKEDKSGVNYKGYQQLVRMGYIRGRFRESFSDPVPFEPGKMTKVKVPMLDIFHTFKKGHRIVIQIQSSDFPLFDINPQNYIDNVYDAEKKDFEKAVHSVYGNSYIVLPLK